MANVTKRGLKCEMCAQEVEKNSQTPERDRISLEWSWKMYIRCIPLRRPTASQRRGEGCPNSKAPSNTTYKCIFSFLDHEGSNEWILHSLAYPKIHCVQVTTELFERKWRIMLLNVYLVFNLHKYLTIQMHKIQTKLKRFKCWLLSYQDVDFIDSLDSLLCT